MDILFLETWSFFGDGYFLVFEDLFHLFSHAIVLLYDLVLLAVVGAAEGSGLWSVQDLQEFYKWLRGFGHELILDPVVSSGDEFLSLLV